MLLLLKTLPIWGKALGILLVLGTLLTTYKVWEHRIYRQGYKAAIAKVEAQQAKAIKLANKAREQLTQACARDSAACVPEEWFRDED